jgi:hypothetical protein
LAFSDHVGRCAGLAKAGLPAGGLLNTFTDREIDMGYLPFSKTIYPLFIFIVMTIVGCGVPQTSSDFDKTPEAQFLKATVSQVESKDYAAIEALMDSRVNQPDIRQALDRLRGQIPDGQPIHMEPVDWSFVKKTNAQSNSTDARNAKVAIEYAYPGPKWLLASANLSGEPGNFRIVSFNLVPLSESMTQKNAFTLKEKSALHYIFLVCAVTAFVLSIYALVRCLRLKGLRHKWLWVIFTSFGFVVFSINWTNGAVFINPLAFYLFGAAFVRDGWVGPWVVSFTLPVGAIVFLWKQRAALFGAVSSDQSE